MGEFPIRTSCYSPYHLFIATIDGQDYKIPHVMDDEEFELAMKLIGGYMPAGLRAYHFSNVDQLMLNRVVETLPIFSVPIVELFGTEPAQPMKLKDKVREETCVITRKYKDFVLCDDEYRGNRFHLVDGLHTSIVTELRVQPIGLKEARLYIKKHHRHCGPPKFHKFSVSLTVKGEVEPVGVAVASIPKARGLMDGTTLEVNRVCSDSRYADACSKLYALAVRAGKNLGYRRFISYTLPEESGASLKAAGFHFEGMTKTSAHGWDREKRPRNTEQYPPGMKKRWVLSL